jgi:hypothetical protein
MVPPPLNILFLVILDNGQHGCEKKQNITGKADAISSSQVSCSFFQIFLAKHVLLMVDKAALLTGFFCTFSDGHQ